MVLILVNYNFVHGEKNSTKEWDKSTCTTLKRKQLIKKLRMPIRFESAKRPVFKYSFPHSQILLGNLDICIHTNNGDTNIFPKQIKFVFSVFMQPQNLPTIGPNKQRLTKATEQRCLPQPYEKSLKMVFLVILVKKKTNNS